MTDNLNLTPKQRDEIYDYVTNELLGNDSVPTSFFTEFEGYLYENTVEETKRPSIINAPCPICGPERCVGGIDC